MTELYDQNPAASQLLRDSVDDLPVDVDLLVRGGVSRGRTLRRRRRVGASLAAAVVVGAIGVAASVGPGLLDGGADGRGDIDVATAPTTATTPNTPATTPNTPSSAALEPVPPLGEVDADLVVPAGDVPAVFGEVLGGEVGAISTATGTELVDLPERKFVRFLYDGTDTSFIVENAEELGTCAELVDPADQPDGLPGGECLVRDGVELLIESPEVGDGVTGQSVMAWRHGYVLTVGSTNGNGKETPVAEEPPISIAQLEQLALDDRWFSGS